MKLTEELLKVGTVYHTDTEEKANELLCKLNSFGFSWKCGQSLMSEDNCYFEFRKDTCYEIEAPKKIVYDTISFFKKEKSKIIEYVLDRDDQVKPMTNGEYYRKQIDNLSSLDFGVTRVGSKIKICHEMQCNRCIFNQNCGEFRYKWFYAIHKENVLSKKEKEYLENFIKPFKKRVFDLILVDHFDGLIYLNIDLFNEVISLPIFKECKMFKNMESNKRYTIEELGLFEEDEDHELSC